MAYVVTHSFVEPDFNKLAKNENADCSLCMLSEMAPTIDGGYELHCKAALYDIETLSCFVHKKHQGDKDTWALEIVRDYILEHLEKTKTTPAFEVFIVWKAKVLQNWKYLISSTLPDGMYYELTYNGDKAEWYLDAYKKFENRRIAAGTI